MTLRKRKSISVKAAKKNCFEKIVTRIDQETDDYHRIHDEPSEQHDDDQFTDLMKEATMYKQAFERLDEAHPKAHKKQYPSLYEQVIKNNEAWAPRRRWTS